MVADLLEAGERSEHHSAPLDAAGIITFKSLRENLDRLLIENGLGFREAAKNLHLGLVRQVRGDARVGLHPAQNVRRYQAPQRRVAGVLVVLQCLGEIPELCRAAKQAGIDEIEDRPQVAETVFNGCAGECYTVRAFEFFHRLGLARAGVFDRLGLVEHDPRPIDFRQPFESDDHAVGGDHQADAAQLLCGGFCQLF